MTLDICTFVRLDTQRAAFDRVGDALAQDDGGDGYGPDDDDGSAGVAVAI